MISVYGKILQRINKQPAGSVFITADFSDIANQAGLDKALSTLVKDGVLRRLSRGLYDYPKKHPKLGVLPPDRDKVVSAIQRKTGDVLQITGAQAANMLGLSTQVPAKTVYLTNGYTRTLHIGKWIITLKHAGPAILAGAGQMAGCVLQALRFMGKHNVNDKMVLTIKSRLSQKDKKQLKQLIPLAPTWAYQTLQTITDNN